MSSDRPFKDYRVPDLSPGDRRELRDARPRWIFVAESPHINEVEPAEARLRRPLCGSAGLRWWGVVSEVLEGAPNRDVSLERLLELCRTHGLAVMNAVQYPLDPGITRKFPGADPLKNLGFAKGSGPRSFRKLKGSKEVRAAIEDLRRRLEEPAVRALPIACLGHDARWFVTEALGGEEAAKERIREMIPHPSAWWRRKGVYEKQARDTLLRIFGC